MSPRISKFGIALAIAMLLIGPSVAGNVSGQSGPHTGAAGRADPSPISGHNPLTLTSPHNQYVGLLGDSVAISPDSKFVVVGTEETVQGQQFAGRVYCFNSTNGAVIRSLTSPDPQTDGGFGSSVAIGGGLLAVGASGESADGVEHAGHVYLFNALTGVLLQTLSSPHAQRNGDFGGSVALTGDDTVVVGAGLEGAGGQKASGHAYVFSASSGALVRTLQHSPQLAAEFGFSVAAYGNLILVGARGESVNATLSGAAYLFNSASGDLVRTFASSDPDADGNFGTSVALDSGFAVVGAMGETGNRSGLYWAGHAYVFDAKTGSLVFKLTNPRQQQYGYFGYSVAISGGRVAVGAPMEAPGQFYEAGNVYVFSLKNGSSVQQLSSPNKFVRGEFGYATALLGKLLIIGAPYESAFDVYASGRAYVYQ